MFLNIPSFPRGIRRCARRLWTGFAADRRGNTAMIFGLAAIPAVLATGAAIDFSRALAQRTNLQQATDSTVLAAAHTYLNTLSTPVSIVSFSQNYISGLMNGAVVSGATLSSLNTQVCITTTFNVPTAFMKIAKINNVPVGATSCSQIGSTYEVALALDNSGSMADSAGGQSKIQALQSAATQLVGMLIPSGSTNPQTAISIVPFTSMVNVGTNALAPFLDTAGASSIHWQNFNRPAKTTFVPTSKFDLFNAMTNASWGGCVEERPYPYTTTDTAATSSVPDSMFVPYFAPDDPGVLDGGGTGYACYPASGSCSNGKAGAPYLFYNSYISDTGSSTTAGTCASSTSYATADNASVSGGQSNVYPGSGMSMVCKYKGSKVTSVTSGMGIPTGPNYLCTSQQMTPLTTSSTTLNNAISSMAAYGSTNLATGFMWAWRSISPVVAPFPVVSLLPVGPQNPKAYGASSPPNTKIIILMTDGMNSWTASSDNPWGSLYEGLGYYVNGRINSYLTSSISPGGQTCGGSTTTASSFRCQMDNLTLEACTNAKKQNIVIYTVGFSTTSDPIDSAGVSLLTNCATKSSYYYPAADNTALMAAFQSIAASIQNLRISQ